MTLRTAVVTVLVGLIATMPWAKVLSGGRNIPTLYIAGDSTAAKDDGSPELLGWGEKIGQYLSIAVVNDAISGATMRTFTEGGNCKFSKPDTSDLK